VHHRCVIATNTLTTRSMGRLARTARTVADVRSSLEIEIPHIDKAAEYVVGGGTAGERLGVTANWISPLVKQVGSSPSSMSEGP
jgi:hypothetical protein